MILGFDRRAELARIAVPTLAIAGALDTVAPAPMMQTMAAKIPGARFLTVPGAGISSIWSSHVAFNAALEGFLAEVDGG